MQVPKNLLHSPISCWSKLVLCLVMPIISHSFSPPNSTLNRGTNALFIIPKKPSLRSITTTPPDSVVKFLCCRTSSSSDSFTGHHRLRRRRRSSAQLLHIKRTRDQFRCMNSENNLMEKKRDHSSAPSQTSRSAFPHALTSRFFFLRRRIRNIIPTDGEKQGPGRTAHTIWNLITNLSWEMILDIIGNRDYFIVCALTK